MSDETEETGEMEVLSEQEMARSLVDTAFTKVRIFNELTTDSEAVVCAREVIAGMNPEIMVRLADVDKDRVGDKDRFEACEQILSEMVSKDGKRLKYRWGEAKDPVNNPGTLFRNEDGDWELLLDESLRTDNIKKLPGEIMHEYGAWLMLTDGGLGEKKNIPHVITKHKDSEGKQVEYAATHLIDLTYRNVKMMKENID